MQRISVKFKGTATPVKVATRTVMLSKLDNRQATEYDLKLAAGRAALWDYVMSEVAKLDESMILYTEYAVRTPQVVADYHKRQALIDKARADLGGK